MHLEPKAQCFRRLFFVTVLTHCAINEGLHDSLEVGCSYFGRRYIRTYVYVYVVQAFTATEGRRSDLVQTCTPWPKEFWTPR